MSGRYLCPLGGNPCEWDPRGKYASKEECEVECRGVENEDTLSVVLQYNLEALLEAAASDRIRGINQITGVTVSARDSRSVINALLKGDKCLFRFYHNEEMRKYLYRKYNNDMQLEEIELERNMLRGLRERYGDLYGVGIPLITHTLVYTALLEKYNYIDHLLLELAITGDTEGLEDIYISGLPVIEGSFFDPSYPLSTLNWYYSKYPEEVREKFDQLLYEAKEDELEEIVIGYNQNAFIFALQQGWLTTHEIDSLVESAESVPDYQELYDILEYYHLRFNPFTQTSALPGSIGLR